ncbi:MAG: DUF4928 family protein [Syntrophobacteraceae bacterium]
MAQTLNEKLAAFVAEKGFKGKGPLCVALVVTQHARKMGLPLDPTKLLAKRGAQVLGQGKSAVQAILKRHGITRVLAQEGGRTSRGSVDNMRGYVPLLNELHEQGPVDLDAIEQFWIDRVHDFFAAKPFKIRLDASRSLRTVVGDVLQQATDRQKTTPGVYYAGAVMQHLVGAKLECVLGAGKIEHNCFSTADAPTSRAGDFLVGDVAIHVTTSPSEALIQKCSDNLDDGLRPLIVTLQKGLVVAAGLSENLGLGDRIDIFEIEQFVAANLYELGMFAAGGRRTAVKDLIERYNHTVEQAETDPSLKIELKR